MLRISLSQTLPARARRLSLDEAKRVFGGCLGFGSECVCPEDCCGHPNTATCDASNKCVPVRWVGQEKL